VTHRSPAPPNTTEHRGHRADPVRPASDPVPDASRPDIVDGVPGQPADRTVRKEYTTMKPVDLTWRQRLTLATVTGIVTGITRTIIAWAIEHIASPDN
jgi:hypothetical protein